MSQNWGSGSTQTGSQSSTQQKYFDPQAIYDMLNSYKQRLSGTAGLNNSILYGNKPPAYATAPAYGAPPAPGAPPPGTGGTNTLTAPPGSTPPPGTTQPPAGGPGPGPGAAPPPTGHGPGPFHPDVPAQSTYTAPAAPTTATAAQIAEWRSKTPAAQGAGWGQGWSPADLTKAENDAALNYQKMKTQNAAGAAAPTSAANATPSGYVSSQLKDYVTTKYGAQNADVNPEVLNSLVAKLGPQAALKAYEGWADQNKGNLYMASAQTHGAGDREFGNRTLAAAGYAAPTGQDPSQTSGYGEVPLSSRTANMMMPADGGGDGGGISNTPGQGGGGGLPTSGPITSLPNTTHPPVTGNPGGVVSGTPHPYTGPGVPVPWSYPTATPGSPGGPPAGTPVPGEQHPGGFPHPPGGPPPAPGAPGDPGGGGSGDGLLSVLQELMSGKGYSDAEKQAITEQGANVLAAQKGTAQAQMANHLASSGNAAGYGGAMSSLDNSEAATAANQARQNEIDFANEGERRRELGGSALEQLLGINTAADLGYSGQASSLASLGGGVNSANQGASSFNNQNFQATPDASAKPTPTTTTKPGVGGDSPGKPGTPGPEIAPGTKWGPNATLYDVNGNVINPKTGAMVGPNGEDIPGTAGGHNPPDGSPGIYPGTTWGPNGVLYGPNGEVIDTSTGQPAGSGEQSPTPTGGVPDPTGIEGDPTQTPGYEPPPDVLPPPDGGDPGTGIEGDPSQGDVWTMPTSLSSMATAPPNYFSPGGTNGGQQLTPAQIADLRRRMELWT